MTEGFMSKTPTLALILALSLACGNGAGLAADSSLVQPPAIYDGIQHARVYVPWGKVSFADEAFDYKVGKKKPESLWRKPEAALGPPSS